MKECYKSSKYRTENVKNWNCVTKDQTRRLSMTDVIKQLKPMSISFEIHSVYYHTKSTLSSAQHKMVSKINTKAAADLLTRHLLNCLDGVYLCTIFCPCVFCLSLPYSFVSTSESNFIIFFFVHLFSLWSLLYYRILCG